MVLSQAEKQRRYRLKRDTDPSRREQYLRNERERYKMLKGVGKKKNRDEMTKRELRSKRKYWKNYKRDLRKRQTNMKNILTPPGSPHTNDEQAVQEEGVPVALQENVPGPSRQNIASKRKRKREKAKVYRKNKLLIRKLEESNRRVQMYRMRLKREKNKMNLIENKKLETPRSRTKRLFKHASRNFKSVRKTLDFHHVLINEMQNSCEKNKSMRTSILEILRGKLFRKY